MYVEGSERSLSGSHRNRVNTGHAMLVPWDLKESVIETNS